MPTKRVSVGTVELRFSLVDPLTVALIVVTITICTLLLDTGWMLMSPVVLEISNSATASTVVAS